MTSDKVGAGGGGRRNVLLESEKKEGVFLPPSWVERTTARYTQGKTPAKAG
ncbi:hypothetical protein PAAG_11155 [Paracoccidioides lutzii Pb01]|uniref:Uncharacterized protein n=1 Tax=Paracoccidioides lutzii (strain ATCC MYA-826 / Pb01) TaxID=502779 RepID=A0A0A2V6J8_PARBA|nr:hypothetical protein PAAG_11155 [Paracoccidioides lutzii Pb01]KGQ01982.1 hypothetical protein PAAG_11155 [Paracoccidioides lutzii Pb01]